MVHKFKNNEERKAAFAQMAEDGTLKNRSNKSSKPKKTKIKKERHELSSLSSRDRRAGSTILRWPHSGDKIKVHIKDTKEHFYAEWKGSHYRMKTG